MELLGAPGKPDERAANQIEPQSVGQAIRSISGPLIRQIRRFQTLELCLQALSPRLREHCAPFDVKMVPGTQAEPVCMACWYVATQTAQTALESRKREMLQQINERSPQLVEDFRYELAGPEKVRQQLNILSAGPD